MRPPAFWQAPAPTLAARLLQPIGAVYGEVAARRMGRPGRRLSIPVVCVGNFVAGGAGKTPTALALGEMALALGETPFFLTRGYGGGVRDAVLVDPARHGASDVGDEALLLARAAPAIVARDRPQGADLALRLGASVIVMDDGLQNPSLEKALRLAVVDGAAGIGNGLCHPAGPLRAPLARQWPHADALLAIGPGEAGARLAEAARARGLPAFAAELAPDPAVAAELRGRAVVAFAGIGRPEKFFATLERAGAKIAGRRAFADHHPYSRAELSVLAAEAAAKGAALATTDKDFVRIAPADRPAGLLALPVRLAAPEDLARLLAGSLARFRRRA